MEAKRISPQTYLGLFSVGVISHRFFDQLISNLVVGVVVCGLFGLIVWRRKKCICWIIAFVIGLAWANFQAVSVFNASIDKELEKKNVVIAGTVSGVPVKKESYTQFEFNIDALNWNGSPFDSPGKARLKYYGESLDIRANQSWTFLVRLKRARGLQNPGSQFDYETWLFSNRIRVTGYVKDDEINTLNNSQSNQFSIPRFRSKFESYVLTQLGESQATGILTALLVGLRGTMNEETWGILRKTGTIHLVAISGLHISFVAGLVIWISAKLWRLTGRLQNRLTARDFSLMAGVLMAIIYALLAGMTIPTRRALVMLITMALAYLSRRQPKLSEVLIVSLSAVLVFDPLSSLDNGFWLSFGAVAIIALLLSKQQRESHWAKKLKNGARQWILIQLGLGLGMAPLLILFFNQVSLVAPLANLFAVPMVTILIVPVSLFGMLCYVSDHFDIAVWALGIGQLGIEYLLSMLTVMQNHGVAVWFPGSRPIWILGFVIVGFLVVNLKILKYRYIISLLWVSPLLLFAQPKIPLGSFKYTMLDAGQGLASVVETRNHTLIYDTGPNFVGGLDSGETIVVPYLRYIGRKKIDKLIISHEHNDHAGGMNSVLKSSDIQSVLSGVPHIFKNAKACYRGQTWQWDGVEFEVLWPDLPALDNFLSGNDASCVIQIRSEYGSLLLTGDIEKEVEFSLVSSSSSKLRSTVLQVPHQGSKTSSSSGFLARVKPEIAVLSAGYKNKFGHPHRSIMDRYEAFEIPVLSTPESGAITIVFSNKTKNGYRIIRHRENLTGYWYN